MASENKDYISQPPLELDMAWLLSSDQWDMSRSDLYNLQGAFLGILPLFPLTPFMLAGILTHDEPL